MVTRAIPALLAGFACAAGACLPDERPEIIAHRALGVGERGENLPENVPRAFALGFGAEIDVRGDGARPFELGHIEPNGHDLFEVFDLVAGAWQPEFAGRVLILDISNDEGDVISRGLVDVLYDEVAGTELSRLRFVIASSNLESLSRLRSAHEARAAGVLSPGLQVRFAMTYWHSPEYTTPDWIDYTSTNVTELGEFAHPKPLLLFGADSRQTMRQALTSNSDIFGVVTDHPRRWDAAW